MPSRALSSGEPRRCVAVAWGSQFYFRAGHLGLHRPGCSPRVVEALIWGDQGTRGGVSPVSSSALSLGVRSWVGCSVHVLGAQKCISLGVHARILVCAYIRIHSSASLSQDLGSLLRLGGHHDFVPFRLFSKSFKRVLLSSRGENSAFFLPFYPKAKFEKVFVNTSHPQGMSKVFISCSLSHSN